MPAQKTTELWQSCLKYIREHVGEEDYSRTFAHVRLETFVVASQTLVLQVSNQYFVEQIENNEKIFKAFREAITYIFKQRIRLDWHIVVDESTKKSGSLTFGGDESISQAPVDNVDVQKEEKTPYGTTQILPKLESGLNAHQKFSNFIEGDSNKLSRSIGLRIAEHPQGTQFNPMFIYGPSGCGKTHLVNAIGNRCNEVYPNKRVLYISAQQFQQQFSPHVL